jgi:flagellar biosynthesis GTPase FlhF
LITCHLTKLESAFDQVRKAYPKMNPADAALLSSALVVTGRHAIALYEGDQYRWPDDYEKLTKAMSAQFEVLGEAPDTPRKVKAAAEEEPFLMTVGLMPNYSAGEKVLEGRKDLQKTLSEALEGGVEFVYATTDLGWQWALDHVNWSTVSGQDLARRIKVRAQFTEGAVGMEMGAGGTKKRSKAKAAPKAEAAEKEEAAPVKAEAAEAKPEAQPEAKAEAKAEAAPEEETKVAPKKAAAKAKAAPEEEKKAAPKKAAPKKAAPKKAAAKK